MEGEERPVGAQNLPAVLNDPLRPRPKQLYADAAPPLGDSPYLPTAPSRAYFRPYLATIASRWRETGAAAKETATPTVDDVPAVFFRAELRLSEAATFATVFPRPYAHRELHDRLAHYLDVVEVHIGKRVALQSDAFFKAMLSHDAVVEQMSEAVRLVAKLRSRMATVKAALAKAPADIASLAKLAANADLVHRKLKLMATVHQTQPMIQLLLSTADYVTALDLIASTHSILADELSGVHAFRHLPSQLNEMERLIDKMLNTEFQRFVAADLNRPHDDEEPPPDEDKFVSVVSGLLRQKRFHFVEVYKEEAVAAVQATVKQAVIEELAAGDAGDVAVQGTGEGAACTGTVDTLRRLAPRLVAVLQRARSLERVVLQTSLATDIALMEGEDFFSPEEQRAIETKLRRLVDDICDYCMERCANLVNTAEPNMSNEQIARLSTLVDAFSAKCESVCDRPCAKLRSALKNQTGRYVQRFHGERKNKLSLLLDNERWKPAQVPAEFQHIVDHISKTGAFPKPGSPEKTDAERPPAAFLIVDGEPFTVVGVVLLAMRMIGEYCRAGEETAGAALLTGRALIELLKFFNSRCCQLVLGAGALHSAGLKTITTINLGLASRALQLLLWILVAVRRHFGVVEINGALPQGFDGVEKDLTRHVKEIESKLVSIVSGLLSAQLVAWEARPPVPSQQFRNISRHLLKLHEALVGVLPVPQICIVYQTVHRNFKDKIREHLTRLNIVCNGGPQHGVVTSELTFYLQTLVTLQVLPEEELNQKSMDEIWWN